MVPVITDRVQTMACDEYWRLYINPNYFKAVTSDQTAMSLVHEVWHCLRKHFLRARALGVPREKAEICNICQDLEINQTDDLWRRLPSFVCMPDKYNVPEKLTFEEYWYLLKDRNDLSQGTKFVLGAGYPGSGNCGSCAHGHGDADWMLPPPNAAGPDGEKVPGVSAARGEVIIMNTAASIQEAERLGRGTVPAGWVRWSKQVMHPKVNWFEKIPPALQGLMTRVLGDTFTDWRRISRRQHLSPLIVLPGKCGDRPRVAMLIDTSGSMSDKMLAQGLAEVDGVLTTLGWSVEVAVYFCDAAAAPAQRVTCASSLKPIGGGGTDIREGFAAIERDIAQNCYDKPSVVIVVTDGYTPWPEDRPKWLEHCFVVLLAKNGEKPNWLVAGDDELIEIRAE